jgi:hypothetical protein
MQHHFRSVARQSTRLILIDLVRSDLGDEQAAIYRPLLVQARKTGVMVAHSYLADGPGPNLNRQPIEGLSPLPDEAVFIRRSQSTFSSRQFCDWIGATTGPLVFAGAANAAIASANAAAVLGHTVFVSPIAANANQSGALRSGLSLYPLDYSVKSLGDPVENLMRRIVDSEIANG